MQRQASFSQAEYAGKKKQTRRDKFLAEMEQVVPWARLVARLQPFYPKGERGRPPVGLERMSGSVPREAYGEGPSVQSTSIPSGGSTNDRANYNLQTLKGEPRILSAINQSNKAFWGRK